MTHPFGGVKPIVQPLASRVVSAQSVRTTRMRGNRMKRLRFSRWLAIPVVLATVALTGGSNIAAASIVPLPAPVTTTHTQVLPLAGPGETSMTVTTTYTDVAVNPKLVPGGGATTNAGTCWSKTTLARTWSVTANSLLWGIPWSERHEGLYYWDYCHSWTGDAYGFNNGYHACDYSHGIGFNVSVTSCYNRYDPSNGYPDMQLGDRFRVSVAFKGFPIYATHEIAECVQPNGYQYTCIWN